MLANPKEPFASGIDLVNQRQVLVPQLPLHFVDTNRFDALQVAVLQSPGQNEMATGESDA